MPTFAERLKAAREQAGITKAELARRSGLSKSAITQYESGNRQNISMYTASQIANALGIDVKCLIDNFEDEPTHDVDKDDVLLKEAINIVSESIPANEPILATEFAKRLQSVFFELNALGQKEAIARIEEMTHITRFTEKDADAQKEEPTNAET